MASVRICAVVVSFHPELALLERGLLSLRDQVQAIVVVDNGSSQQTTRWLRRKGKTRELHLIEFAENRGVATAQNAGIRWARDRGFTHVLVLDHDSVPEPGMVLSLVSALKQLGNQKVAALGAGYVDPRLNGNPHFVRIGRFLFQRISRGHKGADVVPVDFLISSGALIPLSTLEHVGLMDERLFVDYVDIEWFLRAKSLGYQAFGVFTARMEHRMGTVRRQIWLGKWRYVPSYSPSRFYYIMRNGLLLYRRHYTPWRWVLNDINKNFAIFVIFAVLVPPRLQHIRAMIRGLWDGLRSRDGKLEYPQRD